MTFCWRKVIENKGQHMEKGVETEKNIFNRTTTESRVFEFE